MTDKTSQVACSSDDWEAVCSSHGEERSKIFDSELDRHMMQTITDVKYMIKKSKYTALSEVNFQRGCLDAHNAIRQRDILFVCITLPSRYGNQPLAWSAELADMAHAWAVKLADRGRILYPELPGDPFCLIFYSNIFYMCNLLQNTGIGENIILKEANEQSHLPTGPEIVAGWEEEARVFDFERPRWNPKCQRFSQMVWRDTTELGAARSWNTGNNCVAIVCFYRPGGNSNAPGEFASNVPSSRDCSMSPAKSLASQIKRSVTISAPEDHKGDT
uniref:SCP domain-containing protein n=1 Tax=Heterorhabditis bacteriophora TaxID=37862 RepID=A0A1I7XLV8_HETBA